MERKSVGAGQVLQAWGNILLGRLPFLAIEVTRQCPLRCPGCYAFAEKHFVPGNGNGNGNGNGRPSEYKGSSLVTGILQLVDHHRPLQVSLIGGEPLVRVRELSDLLPALESRGIHIQVVTSAVTPIPSAWSELKKLLITVSVDGLQPEHDARRKPATYERLLRHIEGHRVAIHCTINRQMTLRPGYLRDFLELWSVNRNVRKIWMSIFTPQRGEENEETLPASVRAAVIEELARLAPHFPKLELSRGLLNVYRNPPLHPGVCVFARTTRTISSDLHNRILPCQFGGDPDCSQCGCIGAAGMEAIARHQTPLGIRLGSIYRVSCSIGQGVRRLRQLTPRIARIDVS